MRAADSGLSPLQVLVATDGSNDFASEPNRHAESALAAINDPVEASAWRSGRPVSTYWQQQRHA